MRLHRHASRCNNSLIIWAKGLEIQVDQKLWNRSLITQTLRKLMHLIDMWLVTTTEEKMKIQLLSLQYQQLCQHTGKVKQSLSRSKRNRQEKLRPLQSETVHSRWRRSFVGLSRTQSSTRSSQRRRKKSMLILGPHSLICLNATIVTSLTNSKSSKKNMNMKQNILQQLISQTKRY